MTDMNENNALTSTADANELSAGAASTAAFVFFLILTVACSYAAFVGYFSDFNTYIRITYYIVYILSVFIAIGSFVSALEAYQYKFWKSGTTYGAQLVLISWVVIATLNPENTQGIAWNEPQIFWATFSGVVGILCLLRNIVKTNLIFGVMLTTVQVCFIIPFAIVSIVMIFALKDMLSKPKKVYYN